MSEVFNQLIEGLVRIPSPSKAENEAAAYLTAWLSRHGFEAWVDEAGNAVGTRGSGSKEILLLGHIDTFPGNPPVYREESRLYGRGSVDAKGPLCTFAAAASLTAVPDEWRITVVGAVEEEAASSKGARHVLAQRQAEPPVYCIIGEPSQWDRITLGYKGRLLVHVNLLVPFSHSAGQDSSPAECGVNLWHAIQRYANTVNESREGAFNKLDAGLRAIRSDDEGAFGRVSLTIGFRLPPDISPQALEAAMRELIETYAAAWQVELQIEGHETAYRAPKSNQLVRAFLKAIRATAGQPRFVVKTGTSDMNIVAPIWQCPILAYGPGDSSLDHTPQEHLDLGEYQQAIMVLHRVLVELINPT